MRIDDADLKEKLAEAAADQDLRKALSATIEKAKSVTELSAELGIPVRTTYRYVGDLCKLGLVTAERWRFLHGGGKYALYRSMVRSIVVTYGSDLEVDLVPNEGILGRFMRFWSYMGR